ncbi:hypothetical protein LRP67_16305 [Nocardioides sp. cx-169]|uniref:hypothetical protein n=1 Tax=Nocardioides sp. cx-169 TaxID=2899080 RepID=UPI001E33FC19|nr:hypothetical protein [Nocardioides sp. cx-169]MCD4535656.1 hypothetical protein [Nocardioides sp. cx-169]
MTTQVATTTDDVTRDDVIEALGYLNKSAMQLARCGYTSTRTPRYSFLHASINDLLDELDARA